MPLRSGGGRLKNTRAPESCPTTTAWGCWGQLIDCVVVVGLAFSGERRCLLKRGLGQDSASIKPTTHPPHTTTTGSDRHAHNSKANWGVKARACASPFPFACVDNYFFFGQTRVCVFLLLVCCDPDLKSVGLAVQSVSQTAKKKGARFLSLSRRKT